MRIKKIHIAILLITLSLLVCAGFLYYYFFIKLDSNWVFWRKSGEKIDWNEITYDDDFFPSDETETYGQYGEWSFKKFRPVYAGYGTLDGLNYLIGKYLDDNGREKKVYILVSGDNIVDYPYADNDFVTFYNAYFKENVAVRGTEADVSLEEPAEGFSYDGTESFAFIQKEYSYQCPDFVYLTDEQIAQYVEDGSAGDYVVSKDNYDTYCNLYSMFYTYGYNNVLNSFDDVVSKLEVGDQFTVTYLETDKTFDECKYNYQYAEKLICAVENLNEVYDTYMVGIYIELD